SRSLSAPRPTPPSPSSPCAAWRSWRSTNFSSPADDRVEHRLGELACEGVLLAGVERAKDDQAAARRDLHAVAERGPRANPEQTRDHVVGELAEHNHHSHVGEQLQLSLQIRKAPVALFWRR